MKVKWEYVLLALLVVSSGAYLYFGTSDRIHYSLPKIERIASEDITAIEISRGSTTTTLEKQDGSWIIKPPGTWKADPTKINEMKDVLGRLEITELVSESKDYQRYDLEEAKRALLKIHLAPGKVHEIIIGKVAPTYNHTYVMLPGDPRVYMASGDLPRLFLVPASELRDMLVFEITPSTVTGIEIEYKGSRITLSRHAKPADKAAKGTSSEGAAGPEWTDGRGKAAGTSSVEGLLSSLAKLYCGEYLDDGVRASLANPNIRIALTGAARHSIEIFPKKGEKIPALSSQASSPFVMPDYKYEEMIKHLDRLVRTAGTQKEASGE